MAVRRADGVLTEPVIAERTVEVPDPNIADPAYSRVILAGHPVPVDLLDGYEDALTSPKVKAVREPAVDKALRAPQVTK